MGGAIFISHGVAEIDIFRGAFGKIVKFPSWVVNNTASFRGVGESAAVAGVIGNAGNL